MDTFLIDYTDYWYDGLNDVHSCGLKPEYFYMYLEGINDSDYEPYF